MRFTMTANEQLKQHAPPISVFPPKLWPLPGLTMNFHLPIKIMASSGASPKTLFYQPSCSATRVL